MCPSFGLLDSSITGTATKLSGSSEQTQASITKKQRVVSTIFLSIYFVVVFVLLWAVYAPNVVVNTFSTSRGGALVELQARRQPTDGFQFIIGFDRPAQVAGVWTDVPSYKQESKQFNIRYGELVDFSDSQNGILCTILAHYPLATPQRSVFLYFQPTDSNNQQLKVLKVNLK